MLGDGADRHVDRVVNNLLDPVIVFFMPAVAIGGLHVVWRYRRPWKAAREDRMTLQLAAACRSSGE